MRRLLAIEARRSAMLPMLPVLAVLLVLSPIARHLTPVALWLSRSNDVQSSVQAMGPFVAGVAAWMAAREHRRDIGDLLTGTPYPRLMRWLATWVATIGWAVLSYAAVAAAMFAITTRQASWGHPVVWPVLSGLTSLLACAVLGFVAGRLLPGRFTAPLAAIGVFVTMAASMEWALTGHWLGRLSPIYPSIRESPFFPTDPSLAVAQIVCYLGVMTTAGGLPALSVRDAAPTMRRGGVAAATVGALLIAAATLLVYRSPVGDLGRTTQHPPKAVLAYTPVCATDPLPICVHPAFRAELPALETALAPIAAPLTGTPAMPSGITQARPGPPDTSMHGAGGTALALGFGNFELHGNTITPDLARSYLQTRFALALVTAPPYTNAPAKPGPAQRAVARYLLHQAADTPDPHLLPPSPPDDAAAQRLAALGPRSRQAWFADHAAALRGGTLTAADLPSTEP